jgi:putative transposase
MPVSSHWKCAGKFGVEDLVRGPVVEALGLADPLISPHPLYRALGRSAGDRQESYRSLFRERLAERFIEELRNATNGGWALGDSAFKRRVAKATKRRAEKLPKGRPRAEKAPFSV